MNAAVVADPTAPSHARRVVGFGRLLRDNGFTVGLREVLDAARAAGGDDWSRPVLLRDAWRALFCGRPGDWRRFDELFDAYWLHRGMRRSARVSGHSKRPAERRTLQDLGGAGGQWQADRVEADGAGVAAGDEMRHQGASRAEALDGIDLRRVVDPEQMRQAELLAERLAARMRNRLARRQRTAPRGRRLDLRRVIRHSIPYGGTPMRLAFRRRAPTPLRLVLMLDASGSMSAYGPFFLRFMRGVLDTFRQADAYVFHTRLVHISEVLRERNPEKAMERLSLMTVGWSGGTRIGESLATFNRHHARHAVNGRSVVMILSDGYDTSPPEMLAAELARLKKRARRIVWLNPMMGWQGYAPVARGMAAALPHIDLLAPAHNLRSLAALEPYLAKI